MKNGRRSAAVGLLTGGLLILGFTVPSMAAAGDDPGNATAATATTSTTGTSGAGTSGTDTSTAPDAASAAEPTGGSTNGQTDTSTDSHARLAAVQAQEATPDDAGALQDPGDTTSSAECVPEQDTSGRCQDDHTCEGGDLSDDPTQCGDLPNPCIGLDAPDEVDCTLDQFCQLDVNKDSVLCTTPPGDQCEPEDYNGDEQGCGTPPDQCDPKDYNGPLPGCGDAPGDGDHGGGNGGGHGGGTGGPPPPGHGGGTTHHGHHHGHHGGGSGPTAGGNTGGDTSGPQGRVPGVTSVSHVAAACGDPVVCSSQVSAPTTRTAASTATATATSGEVLPQTGAPAHSGLLAVLGLALVVLGSTLMRRPAARHRA